MLIIFFFWAHLRFLFFLCFDTLVARSYLTFCELRCWGFVPICLFFLYLSFFILFSLWFYFFGDVLADEIAVPSFALNPLDNIFIFLWEYSFHTRSKELPNFCLSIFNKFFILFVNLELVINQTAFPWIVDFAYSSDSFAIFVFTISFCAIFVNKVAISMLLFILPPTIIYSPITPCFNAKSMLLIVGELADIWVSISVNACATALSYTIFPVAGICIFAFSYFCSMTVLKPFAFN